MGTLAVLRGTQPAPLTLSSVASLCNAQKGCFAAIFGYRVGRKISPEPKALGARASCGVARVQNWLYVLSLGPKQVTHEGLGITFSSVKSSAPKSS